MRALAYGFGMGRVLASKGFSPFRSIAVTAQFLLVFGASATQDTWPVAATMSIGVRTALLALLGIMVVIFGCLVVFALVIRRRSQARPDAGQKRGKGAGEGHHAMGEGAVRVVEDPMVCPACRREFEPRLRFCPFDASRLVPAPQMLERMSEGHRRGVACPHCGRAFEGRVRSCPHDGADLIPMSVYQATHAAHAAHDHDDGMVAKICPECQGRYGYAASFCGKDGVELVVLN